MKSASQNREVEDLETEIFSFLRSVIGVVETYSLKLEDKTGLRGENKLVEVESFVPKKEKKS